MFRIKGEDRISFYVHDTGEEYFLHYDYWPNVPFIYKSSGDIFWEEIVIRKQLQIRSGEACSKDQYNYFGSITTKIILEWNILDRIAIKVWHKKELLGKLYIEFSFTDCLKTVFKNEINSRNLTCTLPWIQSMMGMANYSSKEHLACTNSKKFDELNLIGKKFARKIANYAHERCQGSIQIIKNTIRIISLFFILLL